MIVRLTLVGGERRWEKTIEAASDGAFFGRNAGGKTKMTCGDTWSRRTNCSQMLSGQVDYWMRMVVDMLDDSQ